MQRSMNGSRSYPAFVETILDHTRSSPIPIDGREMVYKPFNQLDKNRLPEIVRGMKATDLQTPYVDRAQMVVALLYLSCGGLDEAHNIVTPYSWSGHTSHGGSPLLNSTVQGDASYIHALCHRAEGQHHGEFGTGWNNSKYWFGTVDANHAVFPSVLNTAKLLLESSTYGKDNQINNFLAKCGDQWQPIVFVELCEHSVGCQDRACMQFCVEVANAEWRFLFDHCWDKL